MKAISSRVGKVKSRGRVLLQGMKNAEQNLEDRDDADKLYLHHTYC